MRSKWEILQERLAEHQRQATKIEREMAWMERTEFPQDLYGQGGCSGCGQHFDTEADFAKHFLVTDERYLNLGICPNKDTKEQS